MSETQTEEENEQTPTEEEGQQEETGEEQPETPTILPDPVHPATFSLGDYITFGNFVRELKGSSIEEATFVVDQDGVRVVHMDPSHVCLVDIELPGNAIPVFDYKASEPTKVAIRVEDLEKVVPRVSKTDDVVFSILDAENATITLRGARDRTFLLNLVPVTIQPAPIPAITLTQKMVFVKSTFLEVLKDANAIADYLTFTGDKQAVRFTTKTDAGAYEQVFTNGKDIELIELLATGPFSMNYSTAYLLAALDVLRDVQSVTLWMDNKAPMRVECSLSSLLAKAKISFWLAPRLVEQVKPEPQMEPDEGPVNDEEPQTEEEGSEDEPPQQEEPVPAE